MGGINGTWGCPWCDPGNPQHYILTINLHGKGWFCWKDRTHRGVRNARLVAALLRISLAEARSLAGERYQIRDDLGSEVERLLRRGQSEPIRQLQVPADSAVPRRAGRLRHSSAI